MSRLLIHVCGIQPDFGEFADQVTSPAIDIVFLHYGAHACHPDPSFVARHRERSVNGLCQFVRVVRIDDQRVGQFMTGACKTAQDQRSSFVLACCNIFFGHQIHSVV